MDSITPKVTHGKQLSLPQLQRVSDEQLTASLRDGQSDALAVRFDRYQKLVLGDVDSPGGLWEHFCAPSLR